MYFFQLHIIVLHYIKNNIESLENNIEEKIAHSAKSLVYRKFINRDNTKISIIVPVFEEEKIIESHLRLFTKELREKYNFELIVSDGGSTDNSVQIARNFADIVVVHNNKERQTISQGRNRGAEQSNSEVLCFLNVDSIPKNLENFLELINKFADKKLDYQKYGAIACYVSGFPEEVLLKDKIFYFIYNNYERILNSFGFGIGRGECQIIRREIFNQVRGYNDNIVAGEDFDLYRRISKISKVKFDTKFIILESPRRFRKYGYLKTIFFWIVNALSVSWFGKSASKEWEAVR